MVTHSQLLSLLFSFDILLCVYSYKSVLGRECYQFNQPCYFLEILLHRIYQGCLVQLEMSMSI